MGWDMVWLGEKEAGSVERGVLMNWLGSGGRGGVRFG